MIITSDCQKYHATRVKYFIASFSSASGIPFLPTTIRIGEGRTEGGGRRAECWSGGGLGLALNKLAILTGYAPTERRHADTPTRFP
jgi:hypothetical protein